jgi:hypothetical protein
MSLETLPTTNLPRNLVPAARPTPTRRPGLILGACMLLLGCDVDELEIGDDEVELDDDAGRPSTNESLAHASVDPLATTSFEACPAERRIAIVNDGACLDIAGSGGWWRAQPLLADGTPVLDEATGPLPEIIGEYCRLDWDGPDAPPDLTVIDELEGQASDCAVSWAQADALTNRLGDDLRVAFYGQMDRLASLPAASRVGVTVSIVDSAPGAVIGPRSDHGPTMGTIVESIACPAGSCPLLMRYDLALPRYAEHGIDFIHGGEYGTQSELAKAIYAAVRRWEIAADSTPLVINLSVGWDLEFGGGGAVGSMPAPVRAVYHSLQYASCRGALIVAAAGNATGDTCEEGPVAPALWEQRLAPTQAECEAFGVPGATQQVGRPLLHAVAGLTHDNQPLSNSRAGGRSRLATPAFVAVAGENLEQTTPMTGSSVAAAVVTGIAATVWSYRPTMSAGQVMDAIYGGGIPLTPTVSADFGRPVGGVLQPIRRVSVCKALQTACVGMACRRRGCNRRARRRPVARDERRHAHQLRRHV